MGLFKKEKDTMLYYCPKCNAFMEMGGFESRKCKRCDSESFDFRYVSREMENWSFSSTQERIDKVGEIYKQVYSLAPACSIWSAEWRELDNAGKQLRLIEAREQYDSLGL